MGKALNLLENHFVDYLDDSDEATHIYEVAMAIRQMTQTKLALRAVWRLVPAVCPLSPCPTTRIARFADPSLDRS